MKWFILIIFVLPILLSSGCLSSPQSTFDDSSASNGNYHTESSHNTVQDAIDYCKSNPNGRYVGTLSVDNDVTAVIIKCELFINSDKTFVIDDVYKKNAWISSGKAIEYCDKNPHGTYMDTVFTGNGIGLPFSIECS